MDSSLVPPTLHGSEIWALIPIGFSVVKVRDGIEGVCPADAVFDDLVRHTDDRTGVHAATEFGQNGRSWSNPSLNGLPK